MAAYPSASERLSRRPREVPPASRTDLVVEAIALIGLLVNLGLIVYGIQYLPATVPTHVGFSGRIDAYGSKWITLVLFSVTAVGLYSLCTIANRYPFVFNYPVVVTEANAPELYRLARSMMRWMKAIFVWNIAALSWEFIVVLPSFPARSGNSLFVLALFIAAMAVVIVYYVRKILRASRGSASQVR